VRILAVLDPEMNRPRCGLLCCFLIVVAGALSAGCSVNQLGSQ
jgi:hypothetical protein